MAMTPQKFAEEDARLFGIGFTRTYDHEAIEYIPSHQMTVYADYEANPAEDQAYNRGVRDSIAVLMKWFWRRNHDAQAARLDMEGLIKNAVPPAPTVSLDDICDSEKDLLVDMSTEPHPDLKLSWGAWMTVALGGLRGAGYVIQQNSRYLLTEKGQARAKVVCAERGYTKP